MEAGRPATSAAPALRIGVLAVRPVPPELALGQGRLAVSGGVVVFQILGVRISTEHAAKVPGETPEPGGDRGQS